MLLNQIRNVTSATKIQSVVYVNTWIVSVRLEIADILRVCRAKGTDLTILIILTDDIEMYPGRRFSVSFAKTYWKAQDKIIECGDCEKGFHSTCAKLVAETISIFLNLVWEIGIALTMKLIVVYALMLC